MARVTQRTQDCTLVEARTRLAQAKSMVFVAGLVLDDPDDVAFPSVAVALAVLAGIAASDAACCAALRKRPRAQSHAEATAVVGTINPNGKAMSRHLAELLGVKDESHYGLRLVTEAKARNLLRSAERLLELAESTVQRYG